MFFHFSIDSSPPALTVFLNHDLVSGMNGRQSAKYQPLAMTTAALFLSCISQDINKDEQFIWLCLRQRPVMFYIFFLPKNTSLVSEVILFIKDSLVKGCVCVITDTEVQSVSRAVIHLITPAHIVAHFSSHFYMNNAQALSYNRNKIFVLRYYKKS